MNESDVELLVRIQPYTLVLHLPDAEGDMKLRVTDRYVELVRRLAEGVKTFRVVCHGTLPEPLRWAAAFMDRFGLVTRAGNVTHLPQIRKSGPLRCKPDPENENNVMIPSADVAMCCCDYGLTHIIGNLLTETWAQIREGAALARVRELMRGGDIICRACEYSIPA